MAVMVEDACKPVAGGLHGRCEETERVLRAERDAYRSLLHSIDVRGLTDTNRAKLAAIFGPGLKPSGFAGVR